MVMMSSFNFKTKILFSLSRLARRKTTVVAMQGQKELIFTNPAFFCVKPVKSLYKNPFFPFPYFFFKILVI